MKHREAGFKDNILDPIAQRLKGGTKKDTKGTVNFFTGSLRHKPSGESGPSGEDDDSIGDDESFMRESFMCSFCEPFTDFDATEVGAGDGNNREAQPFQG